MGLYKGSPSWEKARGEGLKVGTVEEMAHAAQVIMILLPDQHHRQVYQDSIVKALAPGKVYDIGFSVFEDRVSNRRHLVTLPPVTLGLGVDADIKAVKLP